ncbi:MAG: response regulator [Azospirillum sp.]|nr:response regulator [Azospirillum sp.]
MSRILLVEDDADVRATLVVSLKIAGFEVDEANDGAEAFAALAQNSYDLIVTDLWMPKVDGIDLLKYLAGRRPKISVIAISGGAPGRAPLDFSVALAETYGADAVFHKPFDNDELVGAVIRMIAGSIK